MTAHGPSIIVRVAARGDGISADGRHFALSAPGDHITEHGDIMAGPHHVVGPCRHYPQCGGCQLQHIDEVSLTEFVRDRVVLALVAQGLEGTQVMPVHLSPSHSRRRAAMRAVLDKGRLKLGYSEEKAHQVIDLAECHTLEPGLFALTGPLRTLLSKLIRQKRAAVQVKMALTDQGVDLLLENLTAEGLAAHEILTAFAIDNNLARLSVDDGLGPETRWEPTPVTVTLSGAPVAYPHFSFLQASFDGEAALTAAVAEIAASSLRVADLFAGLGTFALSLHEGRKIYAAEADRSAVMALQAAANRTGRQIVTEHRDLFRRPLQPDELNRFDAVVLDPPRAGARDQVEQLAASKVPVIAYVSCNPSSFARDARQLVDAGYQLARIWPVGQFRWSTHVEMVGEFVRD